MIVRFSEKAPSVGLGYQEGELVELDDKKKIKTIHLVTLVDSDGNPKGQKMSEREYSVSELLEMGICFASNEKYDKVFVDAKKKAEAEKKDFYVLVNAEKEAKAFFI